MYNAVLRYFAIDHDQPTGRYSRLARQGRRITEYRVRSIEQGYRNQMITIWKSDIPVLFQGFGTAVGMPCHAMPRREN